MKIKGARPSALKNRNNLPRSEQQTLIQGLREKSPEACEKLVRSHAAALYLLSTRILGHERQAEEVVCASLLRFVKSIGDIHPDSSLYGSLSGIVIQEALTRLESPLSGESGSFERHLPELEGGQHAGAVSNRDPLLQETTGVQEFFESCILELPRKYRLPYLLKDVEQVPDQQVCTLLGLDDSSMKRRVHQARLILRRRIEKHLASIPTSQDSAERAGHPG